MSLIENWIEKNQQKSDSEKNRLALGLAFILTIAIVLVWLFVNPLLINDQKSDTTDDQENETASEESSTGMFSFFGDILKVLGGSKDTEESN